MLKPSSGPPEGMSFWHPAALLATWFGVGFLPKMPGTWGSLAALPIAWVLAGRYGPWGLATAVVLLTGLGLWAIHVYLRRAARHDPGEVVVDEVAAQMLACIPAGLDLPAFVLAFVMFRVFDVIKPWPLRTLERRLPGAWGVMADDLGAGLYAGLTVLIYFFVLERLDVLL